MNKANLEFGGHDLDKILEQKEPAESNVEKKVAKAPKKHYRKPSPKASSPTPNYHNEKPFLEEAVRILRSQGRDVFIGKVTMAINPISDQDFPAIRERQPGIRGFFRELRYALDGDSFSPYLLRQDCINVGNRLGGILYNTLEGINPNINDPQLRKAIEDANKKYPYR